MKVKLESRLLGANELIAHNNRNMFSSRGILVINLMSSPGSGKTTILECTIQELAKQIKIGVIEGDLYTDQDARRIEQQGVEVVQINTEGTCHLDAQMISMHIKNWTPVSRSCYLLRMWAIWCVRLNLIWVKIYGSWSSARRKEMIR